MGLELAARLVGGIGLFLLGMRLMTEGLRVAAGHALREILMRSTRTRLRGVASGVLVTSLVQSSSAVTVATIGFVNAGLLGLAQTLAVTYGSNIGTTATGWLVAAIGFHVNVRAFALPLVGIGMGLRLFARDSRLGPLGEALADCISSVRPKPIATKSGTRSGPLPTRAASSIRSPRHLLGVALLWPLTGRLLRFLEARFRTAEEDEARPRFLDRNVLAMPRLAFDAMVLELSRVGRISRRLARTPWARTSGRGRWWPPAGDRWRHWSARSANSRNSSSGAGSRPSWTGCSR